MSAFYWSKAAPGLYYLRDKPGGLGPAVAKVWRVDDNRGAVIYAAHFDHAGVLFNIRERAQPRSFIPLMEREILASFPNARFERENFK